MDQRPLYIVRGSAKNGTVTYNCPSPEWAVQKYRDFIDQGLTDITITGPDGQSLTVADLIGAKGEGAAPEDEAIPGAPQITRRPTFA